MTLMQPLKGLNKKLPVSLNLLMFFSWQKIKATGAISIPGDWGHGKLLF